MASTKKKTVKKAVETTESGAPVGSLITGEYNTSVYKKGIPGWRSEPVEATLEVISPKRARVVHAKMSPGGSKRQDYHVGGVESREQGKIKNISSLYNVKNKSGQKKTTKAKARTGNARARSTATAKDRLDDAKATRKEIANEEKLAKIRAKDARTEIQKQKGATHGIGFWRRSRRSRR